MPLRNDQNADAPDTEMDTWTYGSEKDPLALHQTLAIPSDARKKVHVRAHSITEAGVLKAAERVREL